MFFSSCIIFIILPAILGAAFLTLFERKLIGFSQLRVGPNIVGTFGILQPVADGIKLLIKEFIIVYYSMTYIGFVSVVFIPITVTFVVWFIASFPYMSINSWYSILIFFVVSSFSVYGIIGAGFFSNSKYSFIGAIRAASQFVSYEVSMTTIVVIVIMFMFSFEINIGGFRTSGMMSLPIVFMFWFISILAETARAPFDLVEGESELVSGYNVEYSGVLFTFFFLGEYCMMLIMCMIMVEIFITNNFFFFMFWFFLMVWFFMYFRICYPRIRYDQVMMFNWKFILPCSIGFLSYCSMYFFIVYIISIF